MSSINIQAHRSMIESRMNCGTENDLILKNSSNSSHSDAKSTFIYPKNGGNLDQRSIQGLHLAASSATIPPYHTKSGISKENVSSFHVTSYSKKPSFSKLLISMSCQQTLTAQCIVMNKTLYKSLEKYQ